ncbi:hypothetical protein [Hymenobacter armeniacus]|uniref:Carboxypeptidase regulatory-like domain-containing protein n=1 Tax=Hymenobacter armeniacus TaxID=2771358 RepID=A0ABR8JS11_9BACT|nr:hypothetical protein [Hymenobacter armeniacus]MBD2721591.1 hypothetical protein [Hymenobacter armeniacus]
MNRFLSLRPAQQLTGATTSTRAQRLASASMLRALLLGGLAVLGTAGTALAQDGPAVKAKQADAQCLSFTVENPKLEKVRMDVLCLTHNTFLMSEVNRQASYGSKLNFAGVPAGKYAVLLRVGRERYRYNVQVQKGPQTTISVPELTPAQAPAAIASVTR